jgi:hypothetical protein
LYSFSKQKYIGEVKEDEMGRAFNKNEEKRKNIGYW